MKPQLRVVDENGTVYDLARRIGRGGQGEVWLAVGGRRIVKLLANTPNADAYRKQFAAVRRMDLRELHVAKPIAVLRPPHIGYVAEFLGDMVPLRILVEAPVDGLAQWHIATGGLRRRLRLLAHAGEALHGLHARGIIYGDVSHNNVFVSEPAHADESWLIDLDNLSTDSDPTRAIYTPGYGAPEIVTGRAGCTSLSDAWGFAVLVWQTLTLGHPFVGDLVANGPPEMETKAFQAAVPWVGSLSDASNACSTGLPKEVVVAPRLMKLATKTFERSSHDRTNRPGVATWVEDLHGCADQTIACRKCRGSYYCNLGACPWCDEPAPGLERIRILHWDPDKGLVQGVSGAQQLPLGSDVLVLTQRHLFGVAGVRGRKPVAELRLVERGIAVASMPGVQIWLAKASAPGERTEATERGRIVPTRGWLLFVSPRDEAQRVVELGASA